MLTSAVINFTMEHVLFLPTIHYVAMFALLPLTFA